MASAEPLRMVRHGPDDVQEGAADPTSLADVTRSFLRLELKAELQAQFQTMRQDIVRDISRRAHLDKKELVSEIRKVMFTQGTGSSAGSSQAPVDETAVNLSSWRRAEEKDDTGDERTKPGQLRGSRAGKEDARLQIDNGNAAYRTMSRTMSLRSGESDMQGPCFCCRRAFKKFESAVMSSWFNNVVSSVVVLNAFTIGLEVDHKARSHGTGLPGGNELNLAFGFIFTSEVAAKLLVMGCVEFFCGEHKGWNRFDFLVVSMQWAEHFMLFCFISAPSSSVKLFSFLQLLRVGRILRMARIIHLVPDLRSMLLSIFSSLRPLFWACFLFVVMIYGVAVCVTEVVNDSLPSSGGVEDPDIGTYFGDLATVMMGLWMCISGGMDWEDMVKPMMRHVSPVMGLFFSAYVAFSVLAMMNVITGIFVENATKYAQQEEEVNIAQTILKFFTRTQLDENGEITWLRFSERLDSDDLKRLFSYADLSLEDAHQIFRLIDSDGNGAVSRKEFYDGWMRLRGSARAVDLMSLMKAVEKMEFRLASLLSTTDQRLTSIAQGSSNTATPASERQEEAQSMINTFSRGMRRSMRSYDVELDDLLEAPVGQAVREAATASGENGYVAITGEE